MFKMTNIGRIDEIESFGAIGKIGIIREKNQQLWLKTIGEVVNFGHIVDFLAIIAASEILEFDDNSSINNINEISETEHFLDLCHNNSISFVGALVRPAETASPQTGLIPLEIPRTSLKALCMRRFVTRYVSSQVTTIALVFSSHRTRSIDSNFRNA
ncbi:unnamed protein product [Protopolystoma xenopodis]|uniref:Uncharacterized protein n=1 Tax=Protopolystoma xenopodis TaxID=117903 RepID=A0A3S5BCK5_9PLAT|nr:unnamed protein product [Protopolystoma xenopodis]